MKIGTHHTHPAADEFPMLGDAELEALAADIKANGQRQAIMLDRAELVLDGRNRYRACIAAGVKPRFETFKGDDPIGFIVSLNIHRRNLNESQRADIAAGLANLKSGQRKGGKERKVSQGDAAELLNVSKRSVERAAFVREHAVPEVHAAVRDGRMKVSAAADLALLPAPKQREIAAKLEGKAEIRSGNVRALARQENKRAAVSRINLEQVGDVPRGAFRLVLTDYPWKHDNSDGHDGARGHGDYPRMSIDEIEAHGRNVVLPALHQEAHIHVMWITNSFLWAIGRLCHAWQQRQHSAFTWAKDRWGMGATWMRGQTEHAIVMARGVPIHTLNEVSTLLEAAVREHSRKPDEMHELLLKHCPGPHLELFAREPRAGWVTWGAEPGKFAARAA